jgi:drug/metabolite transporter (DMT)-like permease
VPLTAAIGWLVYSESIDMLTAAGTALILFGNLLNLKSGKPKIAQVAAESAP